MTVEVQLEKIAEVQDEDVTVEVQGEGIAQEDEMTVHEDGRIVHLLEEMRVPDVKTAGAHRQEVLDVALLYKGKIDLLIINEIQVSVLNVLIEEIRAPLVIEMIMRNVIPALWMIFTLLNERLCFFPTVNIMTQLY